MIFESPGGTTAFDLIVCVERLQTLETRLSSNDVNLIISNGQNKFCKVCNYLKLIRMLNEYLIDMND